MPATERRGRPVRAPKPTRAVQQARDRQAVYARAREALERRSMVRGLVVLAVAVLVASAVRGGLERVFVPGWWRQW